MALIKRYELANGIVAENAYHIVSDVITHKIPSDIPDPGGARPENAPDWVWKKGYYGRICIQVFFSKETRDQGKLPIAQMGVYPTDLAADLRIEFRTETNLNMSIDINSAKSIIEQAYDFLSTTNYYRDALRE